ncbi:MAG: hypothetical protein L3K23_10760 [Thermoplasmata archaeon]|nr:hypothetical protein [Thermoplasmata archaeon]
MTFGSRLSVLFLVALFVGSGAVALVLAPTGGAFTSAAPPAPAFRLASPLAAPAAAAALTASGHVAPSASSCPTPQNQVIWSDSKFFDDVHVAFAVPGDAALSGSHFQTVPCVNNVPTYTNGFWMNISTNVPITNAYVTIWGWNWPVQADRTPAISGYSPVTPRVLPMIVNHPTRQSAYFYFNVYRFFWPGSTVYFNLSVTSANATPSTVFSADRASGIWDPVFYEGGYTNNATFAFSVAAPFVSSVFQNDINISTSPDIFATPSALPNPFQQLQVTLTSLGPGGVLGLPIPQALLYVSAFGNTTFQNRVVGFGPANHSVMQLLRLLGPWPSTRVFLNITAWLPWEGGAVDRIYSPVFAFNWSSQGGWAFPRGGLESNLLFNTTPNVFPNPGRVTLFTGTPVNVTIHETAENITIHSAQLNFRYSDAAGATAGEFQMRAAGNNTSYAVLPGLPSGGVLTFSVTANDVFGNPTSSGNISYLEAGPLGPVIPAGYGMFFFEAVDIAQTGSLVPALNFTLANDTWSETATANTLGFGAPLPVSGPGYLPVAFGTYTLTVRAFGASQVATFPVVNGTPFTIVFFLTNGPVAASASVPVGSIAAPAVAGLIAAAVVVWPVSNWFKERRAKAEAEQKRISL